MCQQYWGTRVFSVHSKVYFRAVSFTNERTKPLSALNLNDLDKKYTICKLPGHTQGDSNLAQRRIFVSEHSVPGRLKYVLFKKKRLG